MPIYEYECGKCRFRFDIKQSYSAVPEALCPQCKGKARRVFSAPPLLFKGGGFYITDHRKGTDPDKIHEGTAGKEEQKGNSAKGK